jgi:hypothetical protein
MGPYSVMYGDCYLVGKISGVYLYVRFQVLTAASMKFRGFWDVAPCSHVEVNRRFRGAYCLHHQGVVRGNTRGATSQNTQNFIYLYFI